MILPGPSILAGVADAAVILAQVDAVGIQLQGQLHVIIDDKGNPITPAEPLQFIAPRPDSASRLLSLARY